MAESAIYLALRKISLVFDQANSSDQMRVVLLKGRATIFPFAVLPEIRIVTIDGRLRRIESELRMIHCFLGEMETRYNNSQVVVSWIAEARKLGCLVEETVDKCIHAFRHPSGVLVFLKQPEGLQILAQLTELESELEHLSKMKKRWGVQVNNNGDPKYVPAHGTATVPYQRQPCHSIIKEPAGHASIRKRLTPSESCPSVVALWGDGGSGKTTLVRSVYMGNTSRHYDNHIWISLSGCSIADVKAILSKVQQELCLEADTAIMDMDIMEDSQQSSRHGRHLIVLDDVQVQVKDDIEKLKRLLPEGSRIVIITTMHKIATEVDPLSKEKLEGFNDVEASNLFSQLAFGETAGNFTKELKEAYDDVIKRLSKGLPQAIISLGASLSLKQKTRSALEQFQGQLKWVDKHNSILNDTQKCLYVSCNNLPMHLKSCLLYCAIFPAGYLLLCEKLVRLWVAEDFIEKQRASELEEEIAECYLMELIRWGFLQRVDCDELSKVISCRMPITVHELVRSISRKEGFGIACDDPELPPTDTHARCLFISKHPKGFIPLADFPHLRTLIVGAESNFLPEDLIPRGDAAYPLPILVLHSLLRTALQTYSTKKMKYLTVLELEGSGFDSLPHAIGNLFNIRYLGLRKTKITSLPVSISGLHNMQTLDLKSTPIKVLPTWTGRLARLRHLLADFVPEGSDPREILGVRVSKRMRLKRFKQLQTLETVQATSSSFVKSLHMLTMLRTLHISNVSHKFWRALCTSVKKLHSLSSLSVRISDDEVVDLKFLVAVSLAKLVIIGGSLDGSLTGIRQLESLELSSCTLVSPLKDIVDYRLTKLRALKLRAIEGVRKLDIPESILQKLYVLHINDLYVPQLEALHIGVPQGATEVGESTGSSLERIAEAAESMTRGALPQEEIEDEEDINDTPLQTRPRVARTTLPHESSEEEIMAPNSNGSLLGEEGIAEDKGTSPKGEKEAPESSSKAPQEGEQVTQVSNTTLQGEAEVTAGSSNEAPYEKTEVQVDRMSNTPLDRNPSATALQREGDVADSTSEALQEGNNELVTEINNTATSPGETLVQEKNRETPQDEVTENSRTAPQGQRETEVKDNSSSEITHGETKAEEDDSSETHQEGNEAIKNPGGTQVKENSSSEITQGETKVEEDNSGETHQEGNEAIENGAAPQLGDIEVTERSSATVQQKEATEGSDETLHEGKQVTKSSSEAPQGEKEVAESSSEAPQGEKEVAESSSEAPQEDVENDLYPSTGRSLCRPAILLLILVTWYFLFQKMFVSRTD